MRGLATRLACRGVRAYQLAWPGRPPRCRYVPSCSAYALEALQAHGARRGAWLAVRRLARCHPWSSMRSDPVPATRRGFGAGGTVRPSEAVESRGTADV